MNAKLRLVGKELYVKKEEDDNLLLLSKRGEEILKIKAVGLTKKQIEEQLFISVNTVHSHRKITYKIEYKKRLCLLDTH